MVETQGGELASFGRQVGQVVFQELPGNQLGRPYDLLGVGE